MKDYQAKGYIFESVIWKLLNHFGYVDVVTENLRGRGADHQIDAYGILAIPTAFMYPIRLICECKCYSDSNQVVLNHIRSFVGVMKDISENYFVNQFGIPNTLNRFTDVGCFFSASSFTKDAQEYAWAHNIFLVSFFNTPVLKPIVDMIRLFIKHYPAYRLTNQTKKQIVDDFWKNTYYSEMVSDVSIAVGILNDVYPIAIVGTGNWLENIDRIDNGFAERVPAIKTLRRTNSTDTIFELYSNGENFSFSLPNVIAKKIIDIIDIRNDGDEIFSIDVPYVRNMGDYSIRRFLKIGVNLPEDEKCSYINSLKENIDDK